ncbi:MAG: ABZJ_00895 family protein [Pseudomonadota bacterium]
MERQFVIDFAKGYVLGTVLLLCLAILLAIFADMELNGGSAMGVLIAGVFFAASKHATRGGDPVDSRLAWRLAWRCGLVGIASSFFLAVIAIALVGPGARAGVLEIMREGGVTFVLLVLAGTLLIHLMAIRFSIPWAVRLMLKQRERAATAKR